MLYCIHMQNIRRLNQVLLPALLLALPLERIPSLSVPVGSTPVTIRISQIIGLVLIVANLPLLWQRRGQLLRQPWIWLVAFNFFALLSALMATNLHRGLMVWAFVLFDCVLAFTVAQIIEMAQLRRYRFWLLAGAVLVCAFAAYQFIGDLAGLSRALTGLRLEYTKELFGFPRVQSTALEPLFFANYLLLPLSLAAVFFVTQRRRYGWLVVVLTTTIILTLSRGADAALIAVAVVTVGIGWFVHQRRRLAGYAVLTLLSVPLALIIIYAGTNIRFHHGAPAHKNAVKAFEQQTTNLSLGESAQGRALARKLAIKAFEQHPIQGIGPGNFGTFANATLPGQFTGTTAIAENEPLELLAETGIIGFGLIVGFFAAVLVSAVRYLLRQPRDERWAWVAAMTIALIGIAVQYQTFSTLYITYIWVSIGFLIRVLRPQPHGQARS